MRRSATGKQRSSIELERKVTTPTYNRSGALERVSFDGQVYIDRIAYNARGERILLALGNGVMTRYVHDRNTGRLRRLRSEQYTVSPSGDYVPSGTKFQDNGYAYDLSGNILGILDRSAIGAQSNMANTSSSTTLAGYPHPVPMTDTFLKRYTYDPTGRLLTADGAEHGTRTIADPWSDLNPKVQDLSAIDSYTESYTYDANGSMTALKHAGDVTYARQFAVESTSNRLTSLTQGSNTYNYVFDAAGQMTHENTERHFGWNHAGRLRDFRNQVVGSQASVSAHYLYGPDGERRVKVVSKQNGPDVITLYVEGGFEHRERRDTGGTTTNDEYQIGGETRTARLRVGTAFANDSSPAELHSLHDHLGSVTTTTHAGGSIFSREEYTPYGESAYGSFEKKRNRFLGKEKDCESQLQLIGARCFAANQTRWLSPDPIGLVDGPGLYNYCQGNPMNHIDISGLQTGPKGSTESEPNPGQSTSTQTQSNEGEDRANLVTSAVDDNPIYEDSSVAIFDSEGVLLDKISRSSDQREVCGVILNQEGEVDRIVGFNDWRDFEAIQPEEKLNLNFQNTIDNKAWPHDGESIWQWTNQIVETDFGIAWESMGGSLDFGAQLNDEFGRDQMFLVGDVLMDTYDLGNFIWGRALSYLGRSEKKALTRADEFGARYTQRISGGGEADDSADQRAILMGHRSAGFAASMLDRTTPMSALMKAQDLKSTSDFYDFHSPFNKAQSDYNTDIEK